MSIWRPIEKSPWWKRCLPIWLHTPVIVIFQLFLVGLFIFVGICFFYFLISAKYDLDEVAKLPRGTTFFDRRGVELDAPGLSGRRMAQREDLPDFLVKALLAREDARFYEHGGVDVRGLARATARNLKDRNFTQGASTLSMQLARNTYEIRAKSLHRKFLEIALTMRIEKQYSKDEILTNYLNRIYFGSGAYGIEQASRIYFGKPTRELHDGECAMLAGIIRGPHIFSPLRNLEKAVEQRNQTLSRMRDAGFIDSVGEQRIKEIEITTADEGRGENRRSHALIAVSRELERVMEAEEILSGGLQVHTTLDAVWQSRLETELSRAVGALEKEPSWSHPKHADHVEGSPDYVQFAAVTTETKTGEILALIGGRDFTHSGYNLAARAKRDLGSAFEPFIAAAAAERGKLVLPGRPIQTGRQIGPTEVERLAKRCGFSGPFLRTEDLFRGAVAATPMEMSVGLATLGNGGKRPKTFMIREIRNAEGKVIYRAQPQMSPALGAPAASEAVGVLKNRAGTRSFTGTTNSGSDAWVMRLGPSGSTAIWIGFDQPKKIAGDARLDALLDEFVARLGN